MKELYQEYDVKMQKTIEVVVSDKQAAELSSLADAGEKLVIIYN